MKRYIFFVMAIFQIHTMMSDQKFRQKFLTWQNSLTQVQKESMSYLIDAYNQAYATKDKHVLSTIETAFEKIMDQWDVLYKPLADAQIFHASVQDYLTLHPQEKSVKKYVMLYKKYDQNPTDKKLYKKLLDAQKELKSKIN